MLCEKVEDRKMKLLSDWSNKSGTSSRRCVCSTWMDHWLNFSGRSWSSSCSVFGCSNEPTLGAHIFHLDVSGEQIVPMCHSCNMNSDLFDLKASALLVSANQSLTCR